MINCIRQTKSESKYILCAESQKLVSIFSNIPFYQHQIVWRRIVLFLSHLRIVKDVTKEILS